MNSLKRPGMDYFLTVAFRSYDIAIWSQTSWRWLEIKLTELGMLTHPEYRKHCLPTFKVVSLAHTNVYDIDAPNL